MEIPASPAQARTAFGGATAPGAGRSMLTADFQTFLTLLTTQMRNQDPLNPMESTEFATQLATFSGVEQQVRTNELLTGLTAGLATLGMGELGSWIGMEARAIMPVNFDGTAVTVQAAPHPLADRLELVVRDEDGTIVQRLPIPLSDAPFEWTGTDAAGDRLPDGTYVLSVESWTGEDLLEERAAMIRAEIEEAQSVNGEIWLTLEGGISVPAAEVLGLRRP